MRRRMLSDTVYVTFHDALKAWYKEGKTHLTPQEICLSAKNLCDVILGLPDAQEGIDDELEDLEEEASCITEASGDSGAAADAMLIEMVAASPPCHRSRARHQGGYLRSQTRSLSSSAS